MSREPVLTVIPAKGRSRRLPGKNLASLAGETLVSMAVRKARQAGVCGRICVATDSPEVAETAERAGAEVPFLRVNDVDDVTSVGTVAHNVATYYEQKMGLIFDELCLIQTTSPLCTAEDIIRCRKVYLAGDSNGPFDSAMAVTQYPAPPQWAMEITPSGLLQPMSTEGILKDRSELSKTYAPTGAIWWGSLARFMKNDGELFAGRMGAYILPPERAVDIDEPQDLEYCRFLLERKSQ